MGEPSINWEYNWSRCLIMGVRMVKPQSLCLLGEPHGWL